MRRLGRFLRPLTGAVIVWIVVGSLRRHAGDAALQPVVPRIQWDRLGLGLLLVIGGYLGLATGAVAIYRSWRQKLGFANAYRLWTRVNLLGYLPEGAAIGRAVGAAERLGVAKDAAAGAVVFPRLIAVAMAAVAGLSLTSVTRFEASSPLALVGDGVAILIFLAPLLLAKPVPVWRLGLRLQRGDAVQPTEPDAVGVSMFTNLAAWMVLGYALVVIAEGALAGVDLSWPVAIGAVALAETFGDVFPLLPAGIGVRDGVMFMVLKSALGFGPAAAVTVLWRIARVIADLLIALPFTALAEPSAEAEYAPGPVELTSGSRFLAPDSSGTLLGSGPPAVTLVRDEAITPAPIEPAPVAADAASAARQQKYTAVAELQRRIRDLEEENAKLKRMYGELALHNSAARGGRRRQPS